MAIKDWDENVAMWIAIGAIGVSIVLPMGIAKIFEAASRARSMDCPVTETLAKSINPAVKQVIKVEKGQCAVYELNN